MVDPRLVYVAVVGALLLVALGLGVRVLWGIVGDAREFRRKRRSGGSESSTERGNGDRSPRDSTESGGNDDAHDALDGATRVSTCPQCGADNDAAFDYCRRCASPLRPGG
ncbi:zinc ribbon domain-containing protein [Halorubrum kocurii]|uniref:DUF7577 domain-containing protein n=1 Tax=Halorubrum kocurii JCM 14978 TaxID=1230456 RepID=M0P0G5_9EURY|nr:zinc ribbon domain-containing protein [Halorubrum kocurii]EMA63536.1 hypothetical protein C468_09630 [Halorubrum kocurii JCM 14978]